MVLRLRLPPPGNWANAKCLGRVKRTEDGKVEDPFFEEDDFNEAVDFCNGEADGEVCEIRHDCLIFALTNNERMGVWGGMSVQDRKAVRKIWPWQGGKEPHPRWKWMPKGEALRKLSPAQKKDLEEDE